MRSVVVLLAASLVGAGRSDAPEAPLITYQWKFMEVDGPGWRSALHPQLQQVARQGAATVWTASRETASKLAEMASSVVGSPRVTADPQGRSTVHSGTVRRLVTEVTREADGPVNHASFVGYVPRLEAFQEGYSAEVSGRKLDQGLLASLTLVNSRITAVHSVPLREVLESKSGRDGKATPVEVAIDVPEYSRSSVSGEWLIPKDGVLVVSLGVHTVADGKGKAVAREHLAVLEAGDPEAPPAVKAAALFMMPDLHVLPLAATGRDWKNLPLATTGRPGAIPLPMPMASPALPSHSLPLPIDRTGQPVEMPPLPEGKTVTMLPGTSEPCASPQSKGATASTEPVPWKKSTLRDTEATQTRFLPSPVEGVYDLGSDSPWHVEAKTYRFTAAPPDDRAPAPPCCDAGAYGG
jgi:hypothetical protein